jgi:carboxypeptidase C (cathepsin A)
MPKTLISWKSASAILLTLSLAAIPTIDALGRAADETPPSPPPAAPPANKPADTPSFEPFPAPKTVHQSAVIGGKKIDYELTVGSIALKDEKGEVAGEVVYTAYVVPSRAGANRPVTFSMNGGPGAASAYLNLGAIGPKHLDFGREGVYASDSAALTDNANSWLDFTDLVFIDPIGTGYSRSRLNEEKTLKTFLNSDEDIHSLAQVIDDWLRLNSRTLSPKYLIGESYGGYRVPRLAEYLQAEMGIGVSGITLVSPFVDPASVTVQDALNPLRWMVDLPTMSASVKERRGEPVTAETMAPIETYVRTEFVQDFFAGQRDKAAVERMSARVTQYLGLDPQLVRRLDGLVPPEVFLREARRDEGKIGSSYEANQTAYDPFPERNESEHYDPSLGATAAFAEAAINVINDQVGWKVNARYYINNFHHVALIFNHTDYNKDQPVTSLRKAVANDPHMAVLIVHGYNDLVCPYMLSKLIVAQMPTFGAPERLKLAVYPGGHMFYARPESASAFKRDAMQNYRVN